MLACKKCESQQFVKNGIVAGKQRYNRKICKATFREGDKRTNEKIIAKKALCILLYAMAKGSFRMLGKILDIYYTMVYRWIREFAKSLPKPTVSEEIQEMEFDEKWHFIGQKKLWPIKWTEKVVDSRRRTVVGSSVIVILQRSDDCMIR